MNEQQIEKAITHFVGVIHANEGKPGEDATMQRALEAWANEVHGYEAANRGLSLFDAELLEAAKSKEFAGEMGMTCARARQRTTRRDDRRPKSPPQAQAVGAARAADGRQEPR